jgi:hypothetical protein
MVLKGTFKTGAKGTVAGKPYRFDLALDSIYVQILPDDAVYSDYVTLPNAAPFSGIYAIVDFDKHDRVVGFTVEGMIEASRASSWKTRLEIDLGILVLQHFSSNVKDQVIEYLQEHLSALLDSKGYLTVAPAYA